MRVELPVVMEVHLLLQRAADVSVVAVALTVAVHRPHITSVSHLPLGDSEPLDVLAPSLIPKMELLERIHCGTCKIDSLCLIARMEVK